jgi:hypothetical protein
LLPTKLKQATVIFFSVIFGGDGVISVPVF